MGGKSTLFVVFEKWTDRASRYKRERHVAYPPFPVFCNFIREMSTTLNDPGFVYATDSSNVGQQPTRSDEKPRGSQRPTRFKSTSVNVRKTEVKDKATAKCPFHIDSRHSLNACLAFRKRSLTERRKFIRDNHICFKCCNSSEHMYKNCTETVKCSICESVNHPAALHGGEKRKEPSTSNPSVEEPPHSGNSSDITEVSNKCTRICGQLASSGRSCSKTVLAKVHHCDRPEQSYLCYVMVDDQSNRTLGRFELFDMFDVPTNMSQPYTLVSCAGDISTQGRRTRDLIVTSLDGSFRLPLPSVLECDCIPYSREEVPTPEIMKHFTHLKEVEVPELSSDARILLLIGRDVPEAHHVIEQRTGPKNAPFAQKLGLGWVVIGEVCLGAHMSDRINVNKTHVLLNGRPSAFPGCDKNFIVNDTYDAGSTGEGVFCVTKQDDMLDLSKDDKDFVDIMDKDFTKDSNGMWVSPLPFRDKRPRLPNNQTHALRRAHILDASMRKNPLKLEHMVTFMRGIIENGHAELAPPLNEDQECWYLPLFGVYHPHKPHQIRGVFDSSAKCNGVSLNDVLLKGPNLTNSLIGVLLRFRKEKVAVTGDIEQMFYCFSVREDHRDFLRFYWYEHNDPSMKLVEYRMCKHVFGNTPSPAVATYGLRKSVQGSEVSEDVKDFVENHFYVDDGLISLPSAQDAITLLKSTQDTLMTSGIRLHKIGSNSQEVLDAFPSDDLARDLKDLDLGSDIVPYQRSLGVSWDLQSDTFTFIVSQHGKPYNRRGVLSTINSIYDPLGFLASVTIQGRILLRDMVKDTVDWDEPLSDNFRDQWENWERSLQDLNMIHIPRMYCRLPQEEVSKELHVYADASEKAIAAVAYLRTVDLDGNVSVGFVFGKSKVAPKHGHSIPRLELCASVLAVEIAEVILDHVTLQPENVHYYVDSMVVLGYLNNRTRRFYIYVGNRVSRILKFTSAEQWNYIPSEQNPADHGTRYTPPILLGDSTWIKGPSHLLDLENTTVTTKGYPLCNPSEDTEIRPDVSVAKTEIRTSHGLGTERFERFSSWKPLVRAIANLQHVCNSFSTSRDKECHGWHMCDNSVESLGCAEQLILKEVQKEFYAKEIQCLESRKSLPRGSSILSLSPVIDGDGILRVGGRLRNAAITAKEKNPILIPGRSYIASLLIRHFASYSSFPQRGLPPRTTYIRGRSTKCRLLDYRQQASSIVDNTSMCKVPQTAW